MDEKNIDDKLKKWKEEKRIIHINDEMQETHGQEDAGANESENSKSISPKRKYGLNNRKKEKIFICIIIGILLAISICSSIFLPQLYNAVSYDIEAEQIIQNGDKSIQLEKYKEGIELYTNVQEFSKYYIDTQEKIKAAKKEYRDKNIDMVNYLLENKQYLQAYDLIQEIEEYLGSDQIIDDSKRETVDVIRDEVQPTVSITYQDTIVEGMQIEIDKIVMQADYLGRIVEKEKVKDCVPKTFELSGANEINLIWGKEKSYIWKVEALPKVISIVAEYDGKELTRGDTIDLRDFEVIGTCTDNSSRIITDYTISTETAENYGEFAVDVVYGDLVDQCVINVKPRESSIEVLKAPSLLRIGTGVSKDDMEVQLLYEDGSKHQLSSEEYEISGGSPQNIGNTTLKVTHGNLTTEVPAVAYKKINMDSIEPFGDQGVDWISKSGEKEDMFGNKYSNCLSMHLYGDYGEGGTKEREVVYYLGGKYIGMEGTISNVDSTYSKPAVIAIYADDEMKYLSPLITDYTQPIKFSVDLGTAEYLHIKIITDNNNYYSELLVSGLFLNQIK